MSTFEVESNPDSFGRSVRIITRLRGPCTKTQVPQKKSSTPLHKKSTSKSPNSHSNRNPCNKRDKSKTPPEEPKSRPTRQSLLAVNPSTKYTMFTSMQPSSTLIVSNKPIIGKSINDTFYTANDWYEFSSTIWKDVSILEFDKVYNEAQSIQSIYQESIKDGITNLFHGKNSCVFLFGPMDGGKSYVLRGSADDKTNEPGWLNRAIVDWFNWVEITKQANINSQINSYYVVNLSVYQVYLENINDLLSPTPVQIQLEKYYEENNINCNMIGWTRKEIRSKEEYDATIRQAIHQRKVLAQYFKVNDWKRKSHFVVSISVDKRERTADGWSYSNERSINNYAQIDFVELASSNYGLMNAIDDESSEGVWYKNSSKVFNAIANNIVCASAVLTPNTESKLTLCLKKTLNSKGSIAFINCVIPWEWPWNHSFKAVKFTNWWRNQVRNWDENKDYQIKTNFDDMSMNQGGENSDHVDSLNIRDNSTRNRSPYPSDNNILYNKNFQEDNSLIPSQNCNLNNPRVNWSVQQGYRNNNIFDATANSQHGQPVNEINHSYTNPNVNRSLINNSNNNIQSAASRGLLLHKNHNDSVNMSEGSRINQFTVNTKKNPFNNNLQTRSMNNNQIFKNYDSNNNNYSSNEENDLKTLRERAKLKYQSREYSPQPHNIMNNGNTNQNNLPHNKSSQNIQPHSNNFKSPEHNYWGHVNSEYQLSPSQGTNPQQQLNYLENSLKQWEERNYEMNQQWENLRLERSRVEESRFGVRGTNSNVTVSYLPDAEVDKIKQEQATLKSDNIIFREDINRWTDINKHWDDELTMQRNRNLELAAETERWNQEILNYEQQLKKANESIAISKLQEQNMVETMNQRVIMETKMRDTESELNRVREDKSKFEIEYRVVKERYDELKKKFDEISTSYHTTKASHNEEICKIDEKIDIMTREMEKLQKENSALRSSDERQRWEIQALEKQRDNFRDKYQEQKNKNNLLSTKWAEIEDDFRNILHEKENEHNIKQKEDELRRVKVDSKVKLVSEWQSKIANYRNERMRKKNEEI